MSNDIHLPAQEPSFLEIKTGPARLQPNEVRGTPARYRTLDWCPSHVNEIEMPVFAGVATKSGPHWLPSAGPGVGPICWFGAGDLISSWFHQRQTD